MRQALPHAIFKLAKVDPEQSPIRAGLIRLLLRLLKASVALAARASTRPNPSTLRVHIMGHLESFWAGLLQDAEVLGLWALTLSCG